MYIEFIVIYAALAVIIGLLVFVLIKLLKSGKNQLGQSVNQSQPQNTYVQQAVNKNTEANPYAAQSQPAQNDGRVVFCYKCGNQYSISENKCPHCGALRG